MTSASTPERPFFSVVIPTYNRANLIVATLNSVIQQTFNDFEVIVVDDCSPDFEVMAENISKLQDARIRLLKHDKNANGAAARNTGIKGSKGDYVCFLDSDDTWPLGRLSLLKNTIEKVSDTSKVVFYGQVDFKFPEEVRGQIKPKVGINDDRVGDYLFIKNGLIQTSTIVCQRVAAEKIMFDERFRRHQDYDFCLRAEHLGYELRFVKAVLSNWLRHRGTSTFAKGATYDHCLFWYEEMQGYLSKNAGRAYCAKILAPIALESGSLSNGFSLCAKNIGVLNVRQVYPVLLKCFKGFVKYVIRTLK